MVKWIVVAAGMAFALPALAQKPADRPAKVVTGPDVAVIKEAVNTLREPGECMVEFTVGLDGKPKDMKPTCTPETYAPYALKAMATVEYLPEIFAGEMFETEGLRQPFKFGVAAPAPSSAPGDKAPVKIKDVEPKDIEGRSIALTRRGRARSHSRSAQMESPRMSNRAAPLRSTTS